MPPPKKNSEQSESKNFTTTGVRVLTGTVDFAISCRKLKNPFDLLLEIFGKRFATEMFVTFSTTHIKNFQLLS